MNSSIKSGAAALLVLACMILPGCPARAQDDTARVVRYAGGSIRAHPDGAVGAVAFHGYFRHASISRPRSHSFAATQTYQGALSWVVADQGSLMARFQTIDEDTIRYELAFGLRAYSGNPVATSRDINPDGPVGIPVVSLWGGTRYNELSIKEPKYLADLEILVPVSRRFSVAAGYQVFEAILETDVRTVYGTVSFYVDRYEADSAYINPDGPVNNVAFHLSGGGSSKGAFGDLVLLLPISRNLTWKLSLGWEEVELPYRRSTILGVGLSFYPSN